MDDNVIQFPLRAKPPRPIKLVVEDKEYEVYAKDCKVTRRDGYYAGSYTEISIVLVTNQLDDEARVKLAKDLYRSTLPRFREEE